MPLYPLPPFTRGGKEAREGLLSLVRVFFFCRFYARNGLVTTTTGE